MNYWVIGSGSSDDGAILVGLPEVGPKDFEYSEGLPLLKNYPNRNEALVILDADYPDQMKLYDFINNSDAALVVNEKVKNIISELQPEGCEFLPITVLAHDKSVLSQEYYIVNSLISLPIIDMDESEYDRSPLYPEKISVIDELCITEAFDSQENHLFRAHTMPSLICVSNTLKERLEKESIDGYVVFDAQGWDGLFI